MRYQLVSYFFGKRIQHEFCNDQWVVCDDAPDSFSITAGKSARTGGIASRKPATQALIR